MKSKHYLAMGNFWMFWHMPKCGGSSFTEILEKIFAVKKDYHPEDRTSLEYKEYLLNPIDLNKLNFKNCLIGHYNIEGIKLWQRYPDIERLKPIIFTILRDPLETAVSGVRFGIQKGWINKDLNQIELDKIFLGRSKYFSNVFGIKKSEEVHILKKLIWKSVDIKNANILLKHIQNELIKSEEFNQEKLCFESFEIPIINVTSNKYKYYPSLKARDEFLKKSTLDYDIYNSLSSNL